MPTDSQQSQGPHDESFMDDFFAECDDHLRGIREALLALEPQLAGGQADRGLLDDLFRSFHSLKGIAGMVGLGPAEQLAHASEAVLRALRGGAAGIAPAAYDALLAATRALEQVVEARRAGAPLPEIAPALELLVALGGDDEAASSQQAESTAAQQGGPVWSVIFRPSAALAERGVNVSSVRGRLQALGALVRGEPQVSTAQGLAFEFLLAARLDAAAVKVLEDDGMRVTPYIPAEAPSATSPASPPLPAAAPEPSAPTLRVDMARLDELLQLVGELLVNRAQLSRQIEQLEPLIPRADWRALQETSHALGRRLRDVRAGVVRVRMVPVGEAFARLRFVIHDVARELGRPVAVVLHGQETEIDKYVMERVLDPLMHLVRNAVGHGLEPPEARRSAGKAATGTIRLFAASVGDNIVIEVEDDGAGVDAPAVLARARELRLLGDGPPGPDALLDALCAPGLSTQAVADRIGGRGVGLDVVRTAVRALNGTLSLRTAPGRGTTFRITLPLTLLVVDALLAEVGAQVFAVPLVRVREIVEVEQERVTALEGREIMLHRGRVLPLLRVARRFSLAEEPAARRYAFVVGSTDSQDAAVGLVVDRLLGKREIVVRPISDVLGRTPGIGGATDAGDGRPVLIIDVPGLLGLAT